MKYLIALSLLIGCLSAHANLYGAKARSLPNRNGLVKESAHGPLTPRLVSSGDSLQRAIDAIPLPVSYADIARYMKVVRELEARLK